MKKGTRRFAVLVSWLLIVTVLLAACGGGQPGEPAGPSDSGGTDAANWPEKPIELVVPYAPGGDTDFHARTYAKYLEKELGKPVVVVNMEGANGTVGATKVKDAKPDGYTALWFHESMLVNNVIGTSDFSHKDFEVVAIGVYDDTYVPAVHEDAPYANLKEFIEDAKKSPGKKIYGTQIGGFTYNFGTLLEDASGAVFNKVDGGAPARNAALLAKEMDINAGPYGSIDSGDFRALAVMSGERSKLFPDVPTAVEQGYDVDVKRAYFMLIKGPDPAIVKKMSDAMGKISQLPEYAADIEKTYSVQPGYSPTEESSQYLDDALERYMQARQALIAFRRKPEHEFT
ncbi:tripartite tricarboxylate transporter family receptor [Paenibacillus sp. 32O-W]|uniref:tripartite tricarboxylate transporter substrate binding protein n=1 Tax=Paenibacillus sp. 32O-W TaxID=1695218 RepID=UPI0007214A00|nr:tripartite tricarboxylate transporter substrate binding protein [Paenibacillus sp. 32O-W]ALS28783.1 tripartite tricarboxylate transporter family receptor [Paenibacillus sp. 32O-W]